MMGVVTRLCEMLLRYVCIRALLTQVDALTVLHTLYSNWHPV